MRRLPRSASGPRQPTRTVSGPLGRSTCPRARRSSSSRRSLSPTASATWCDWRPDLVIGADPSDPETLFYRALDMAVDDSGNIYIADTGNHRVQVFDHDGNFVRTLGRRGQGPGELEHPNRVEIVGERVFVWDLRKRQFLTWGLDGTLGPRQPMQGVSRAEEVGILSEDELILIHGKIDRPADGSPPANVVAAGIRRARIPRRWHRGTRIPATAEPLSERPLRPFSHHGCRHPRRRLRLDS